MVKLGKAFLDSLERGRRKRFLPQQRQLRGWGARLTLFYLILIFGFSWLLIRLFHLTVAKGIEYRRLAQNNRIRTVIMHAPRGIFYDRRGVPLVENIPGFRLVGPCPKSINCDFKKFFTKDELKQINLSHDFYLLEKDYFRKYLYPFATAHVLGYLTEITQDELSNAFYTYQGYRASDWIGRMGLEETLQKDLRGVDGRELIEVDANGQKIRTLGEVEPIAGKDIRLTIDSDLQKVAYEALGENPGAVIVSQPKSGEILVLVSTPGFDINRFQLGMSETEFLQLVQSSDHPLFNKAISGVYAPGSIFKLITAIAALEENKITKDTLIEDTGVLQVGASTFGNWYFNQYGRKEGMVDLLKGIARSNDIFFYKVGEALGISTLAQWGKRFGIGKKTGIELSGEAEGLMPDPLWRDKVTGQKWYLGDTYNVSIGQGDILTTPLQVNMLTNAIASGGVLCQPTLIKDAAFKQPDIKPNCIDLDISKATIDLVIEGMRRACYRGNDISYQGTGWPFFDFKVYKEELTDGSGAGTLQTIPVACKTGTAETPDDAGKTHAWFSAFAPLNVDYAVSAPLLKGDPEIVVTVLVEHGGEGSTVAAPIARRVMEEWFSR